MAIGLGELHWLLLLLLNDRLQLVLWGLAPKAFLARALLVSARHLRVFVRLLQGRLALRALLLLLLLAPVYVLLQLVRLVDVESQITLQLSDLRLSHLALLKIGLSLLLERCIGLHEVVVELNKLLHFGKGITSHLSLVAHLACRLLLLGILVSRNERLVFSHEELDALLVLHLGSHLGLGQRLNLIPLLVEVGSHEVSKLLHRLNCLRLQLLLRREHLLKRASHVTHGLEFLDRDESAKLGSQVADCLQVRNLPVEEPAQVAKVVQLKREELAVEAQVLLVVHFLLVVHALRDQLVLAGVDDFVDLAFDVTKLVLLSSQLVWLAQAADLRFELLNLITVSCPLHLQIIVVFNEIFDLLFKSFLVHGCQLLLKARLCIQIYRPDAIDLTRRGSLFARAKR